MKTLYKKKYILKIKHLKNKKQITNIHGKVWKKPVVHL